MTAIAARSPRRSCPCSCSARASTLPASSRGRHRAFFVLGVCGLVISSRSATGASTPTDANAAILQATAPVLVALGARAYLASGCARDSALGFRGVDARLLLVVTRGASGGAGARESCGSETSSRCSPWWAGRSTPSTAKRVLPAHRRAHDRRRLRVRHHRADSPAVVTARSPRGRASAPSSPWTVSLHAIRRVAHSGVRRRRARRAQPRGHLPERDAGGGHRHGGAAGGRGHRAMAVGVRPWLCRRGVDDGRPEERPAPRVARASSPRRGSCRIRQLALDRSARRSAPCRPCR